MPGSLGIPQGQQHGHRALGVKLLRHLERDEPAEGDAVQKIGALGPGRPDCLEVMRRHGFDGRPGDRLPSQLRFL